MTLNCLLFSCLTFQVTVRWFSPLLLGLMIRSPWSRVSIIFSDWLKLILWKLGWAITRFMYAGEREKTRGNSVRSVMWKQILHKERAL